MFIYKYTIYKRHNISTFFRPCTEKQIKSEYTSDYQ